MITISLIKASSDAQDCYLLSPACVGVTDCQDPDKGSSSGGAILLYLLGDAISVSNPPRLAYRALKGKINAIAWGAAASDVARFLRPVGEKSPSLWSERFFLAKLKQARALRSAGV
jgi:hypothetical protein